MQLRFYLEERHHSGYATLMIIGIPRERKILEKRVALTPAGAGELIALGHQVLVEAGAGVGSGFLDSDYKQAGAVIVHEQKELWSNAELIIKVKEPDSSEYAYFREGLAVFSYLHPAGLRNVANAMLEGKVTGLAYEMVETTERRLPLLEPMSEIAGKLSIQEGAFFLQTQNGGRGVLLGGAGGAEPGTVLIIGAGIAGCSACSVAVGLGAKVVVMDLSQEKLQKLSGVYGEKIKVVRSEGQALAQQIREADLVVGAVLVPGAAAPKVITLDMIKSMKKGAVFVDISVDQGGCSETTKATSLKDPTYEVHGVVHYAVPNMPGQVPLTSTLALTKRTLPYILELANKGILPAIKANPELAKSVNTYGGKLTNAVVAKALGMESAKMVGTLF